MKDKIFTSQLSRENWDSKYRYDNETPLETQMRVARALASVETDKKHWEKIFLNTLVKFNDDKDAIGLKCTPGGRITANLGTRYQNASSINCYINGPIKNAKISYKREVPECGISIPVEYTSPDTGDNMVNIILTLLEQALTLGSEGGWGINASFIRPRGSIVKGVGVEHPGVVKFLEIFDKMSEVIVAGNNDGYKDSLKNYITEEQLKDIKKKYSGPLKKQARKGACMVTLDINHSDIEEFILAKQKGNSLTKFNMSVLVTDDFLNKVVKDEFFELKFEDTVYKVVRARELYDLIMKSTYHRNEPGILFYDNMQRNNPLAFISPVNSTNPCFPDFLRVMSKTRGEITIKDLEVGEEIFSMEGWTKVLNKFSSGIKEVNEYHTIQGSIPLTEDHLVLTNKGTEKAKIKSVSELEYFYSSNGDDLLINSTSIVRTIPLGKMQVWDITVDNKSHSFMGNNFNISNCGEIPGNPITTTACLLGSLNLTMYVNSDRTFNWSQYIKDITIFTRMLDNVNDLHTKDLPPYLWSIKNLRQIGLGITGFGSMLYMMGISYNSTEAIELALEIGRVKMETALEASAMLAAEKGPAPMWSKKYLQTNYWNNFLKGKISIDVRAKIEKFGLRNLKLFTNPPSGSTSIICNIISNGVEPVFMTSYERKYIVSQWPEGLTLDNIKSLLKQVKVTDMICWEGKYKDKFYYYEPHNRGLCIKEVVEDFGYKWVKENFPNDLTQLTQDESSYLVTSNDLKVEDHLNIQDTFQQFVDQAISKTCSIPNSYPYDDFKNLYLDAWKRGLIGITTYRDGTMESVLSKIEETKKDFDRHIVKNVRLPEKFLNGPCEIIFRENMKFYIHFSYLEEDKEMRFPIAIWLQTNHPFKGEAIYVNRALKSLQDLLLKNGIEKVYVDKLVDKSKDDTPNLKLAKHISMCLRHNLPIVSIISSLENLEGDTVSTLLTAVRKFLSKHIEDGTKALGKVCDKCNSTNIIYEGGCSKCLDCGFSGCS